MSDDELTWHLRFDLAGNGLGEAAADLGKLGKALKLAGAAVDALGVEWRKLSGAAGAVGGMGDKLASLDHLAQGAKMALTGLAAAAGAAALGMHKLDEFGDKAFEAFAERTNTIRGYTALLGDAKKAQAEFQWDQGFGKVAPFKTEDIEALHRRLISSGTMNTREAREGTLAISDLAALQGGERGRIALDKGSQMYSEIGEQGLSMKHLRAISGDLNLSMERIEKAAGKLLGRSEESIRQGIHGGEFASEEGGKLFQTAIKRATMELLGTNKLGEYSQKSANSLQTLLINQGEQMKRVFKSFDSEGLPGVQRYKKSLQDQAVLFDTATESGKRMQGMLKDFADTSAATKSVMEDFKTTFLDSFAKSFMESDLGSSASDSTEQIKRLAEELGHLGKIVREALHAIVPAMEAAGALNLLAETRRETRERLAADENQRQLDELKIQRQGAAEGKMAVGIYNYLQEHKNILAKYPTIMSESIAAKGNSPLERITNALDKLNPAKTKAHEGKVTPHFLHGGKSGRGRGGGMDEGWAVPWARTEGVGGMPERFGANLAEQARMHVEAARVQQVPPEHQAPVNITIIIQPGSHDSAQAIAAAVDQKLDAKFRQIHRFQRTPAPKRG